MMAFRDLEFCRGKADTTEKQSQNLNLCVKNYISD